MLSHFTPSCFPRQKKKYVHTRTYMQVFIATLFAIAKNCEQPKFPSTDEWENKLWYIHIMGKSQQ